MIQRTSMAIWEGNLKHGHGTIRLGTGAFEAPYSFSSRFEHAGGTNPEELIAAAHAGCFSMALAHGLAQAGYAPVRIDTTARVQLEKTDSGFSIPKIHLETTADVPGIDADAFHQQAESAKQNCPVSKVLAGAEITLTARLLA